MTAPDAPGRTVVEAPIEIDMATAGGLRERLLAADPDHTVVVDLTPVTFCDSSGLAVLIAAREHVGSGSGRLVLRNPPPSVRRLLVVTQLEHAFEVEAEIDAE